MFVLEDFLNCSFFCCCFSFRGNFLDALKFVVTSDVLSRQFSVIFFFSISCSFVSDLTFYACEGEGGEEEYQTAFFL